MRLFALALSLLVICSPAWADVTSEATRAAERMDKLYLEAGPEVGSLLYDPCYVLVIGQLRPEGSWNGRPLVDGDRETLERLDRVGETYGLDFSNLEGGLVVRSLEGLSLVSRECAFPGARPFQTTSGWSGWNRWFEELRQGLDGPDDLKPHYVIGVKLGYPDTAIESYIGGGESYLRRSRAVSADINNADYLENGQPEFEMLPEDVNAPDVERTCRRWSEFLAAFYQLPEVRERLGDEDFLAARTKRKGQIDWSANERWLRGDIRAPRQIFEREGSGIGRGEELILQNHIEELEALILSGAPPYEWVRACREWGIEEDRYTLVSPRTMWNWIWWGSYDLNPYRSRLYQATRETNPRLFEAILDEKIKTWARVTAGRDGPWAASETVVLLSNPQFKARFAKMPREQQRKYLEVLERFQDHEAMKLREDPVYRL